MKISKLVQTITVAFLGVALFAGLAMAQKSASNAPRQEKLLNGLKVLIWNVPAADKVTVRIRVHGGSSFDPQGKEGVMKLLSTAIFPTEDTRDFFREELGGSVEITSNYDYIQIDATAKSEEFLSMFETLATAVANPTIDKETTTALRSALMLKVAELEKDPAYLANEAVAKKFYGSFPYGRPQMGTTESLQKIDFADLRFAKDRLFTADNATVAISGSVNGDLVFRAARRYFGAWLKADQKIPSTFRQPDPPATGLSIVASPMPNKSEFRFAMRGLARNDPDFYASKILQRILWRRLQAKEGENSTVLHDPHILPGAYVFGISDWNLGSIKKDGDKIAVPAVDNYKDTFIKNAVTQEEFDRTNREWLAGINPANIAELWLDVDTFKLDGADKEAARATGLKLADVQRVLERLQKEPAAYVLIFAEPAAAAAN